MSSEESWSIIKKRDSFSSIELEYTAEAAAIDSIEFDPTMKLESQDAGSTSSSRSRPPPMTSSATKKLILASKAMSKISQEKHPKFAYMIRRHAQSLDKSLNKADFAKAFQEVKLPDLEELEPVKSSSEAIREAWTSYAISKAREAVQELKPPKYSGDSRIWEIEMCLLELDESQKETEEGVLV